VGVLGSVLIWAGHRIVARAVGKHYGIYLHQRLIQHKWTSWALVAVRES